MINEKMRELGARRSTIRELFEYGKIRKCEIGEENVFDFSLGNPSVPAPREVGEALVRVITEESPISVHGYTSAQGDAAVRAAISDYINQKYEEITSPDCIYMTVGAAAALTCAITAIACPDDEVIVLTPYFPEYKVFIERCGAKIVEVATKEHDFTPDVERISAAINEKTAAIIINSPNNPTGAVYSAEDIAALTRLLKEKEEELGHPIFLISDEPYRELVYGSADVPYLTKYYDDTIVCYSYSKSLSIPGERIGYALVNPRMKNFTAVYQAVCGAGRALGYVCAPSLLQKIIPQCLGITSDVSVYDDNRSLLYSELSSYGYDVVKPQGAFYLFVKSPSGDGAEFSERAKRYELLIVASEDFGCPGYARISYCVKTEMIKRALPAFKKLMDSYK